MNKIQNNQLVIYQAENGEIKVDVKLHDETVWLSLNQMSQIFERDKSVIAKHLKNIFKEGELASSSTVAKFATVQTEGERAIKRKIEYYNLDAILSVGYRVNSKRGIEFRKWASKILRDYLVQGYNINHDKVTSERLAQLKQTVELLSTTLINQNLVTDPGKELLRLIKSYTKTWDMLVRYDEDNGDAGASNLIGLFKTKFAFASDDPRMGEIYSKLCGSVTTISQQKNTSFGANEFRDGVSYNERHEKSPLVSYEDFSRLSTGQCYVILPEISARLAKIQVPQVMAADKNKWFIEEVSESKMLDKVYQQPNNLDSDNITTNNYDSEFNTEIKNDEFILDR